MIVNLARQLCSGIHKVQEEGVGQEIHGDELHWMKVGSTAGVISGLSPGTEKAGEDLQTTYVPDVTKDIIIILIFPGNPPLC
jgi:hypothetical protein